MFLIQLLFSDEHISYVINERKTGVKRLAKKFDSEDACWEFMKNKYYGEIFGHFEEIQNELQES